MTSAKTDRRAILSALFDAAQGWPFSEAEVPLTRGQAPGGNPFVVVNVDGREIVVTEKTAWAEENGEGEREGPAPHRIVAFLAFSGIAVSELKVLLQENLGTHGMPAWGMDDEGDLTLSASLLVGPAVPLDSARRQLLVALGLIAEAVGKILDAVNAESEGEAEAAPSGGGIAKRFLAAL
jgi:hypothetical protein